MPWFETLIKAAVAAPSGDNTQPWRFEVDRDGRFAILVDEARDPSPMNAGQRMSRVAVGAALENVCRTARHNGWEVELLSPGDPARVSLQVRGTHDGGRIEDVILHRVTNRRAYRTETLPAEWWSALEEATPEIGRVRTHWVSDRGTIASLARVVGSADGVMFGTSALRRAFVDNVRFDAAFDAPVEQGLPLASLELSRAAARGLKLLARLPDGMLRTLGGIGNFRRHAQRLVESASGLCIGIAADDKTETDFDAGRAMQRAWLALTARGRAVQPMMSLPVLENVVRHGPAPLREAVKPAQVEALEDELRRALPAAGGRCAFLLRFGAADPPTGRTGRMVPLVRQPPETLAPPGPGLPAAPDSS